jgi:glycosyltransferase involved in cell wall biosynthesis
MMQVSVLIPCHNAALTLERCVASVLAQEPDLLGEIIIVENGSSDNSLEVAQRIARDYPSLVIVESLAAASGNAARNRAFELSSCSMVQWLDADDELAPEKFSQQCPILINGNANVVYSDFLIRTHNINGSSHDAIRKHEAYPDFLYAILLDLWSPPCNYLLTRQVAQKMHNHLAWNPETRVCQDREYFTLAAIHDFRFRYCEGVYSVYHIDHEGFSVSRKIAQEERQRRVIVILDRFQEVILARNPAPSSLYQEIIDTWRLFAFVWLDGRQFQSATPLIRIQWRAIPGIKIKFLMVLRYFGVDTRPLARRLLERH